MNTIDVLIIILIAAAVIAAIIYVVRNKKRRNTMCGCDCSSCGVECPSRKPDTEE